MSKLLWKLALLTPVMLGAIATSAALAGEPVATDKSAIANDPETSVSQLLNQSNSEADPLAGQVTSVSQLTDVQPTDWAFQALQSLVERYGCIEGYPDRTFRGNRALTRYEFAAGLNSCLNRITELISASGGNSQPNSQVNNADLATIQRLQTEFATELATLKGRVDALDTRTTNLEAHQFSTTTKLNGEVVMAIAGVLSGNQVNGFDVQKNTVFGDRVRLNLDTSFTGKDLLRTRLQASNLDPFSATATGTPQGNFRFAAGNDGNNVAIDALLYQFPLGSKTTVVLEANAGAADDFTNTINPFFDGDGGTGALTYFGTRNPIYYLLDGAGIGIRHQISKQIELSAGYLATDANDPSSGKALFDGPYGAIAQLTFTPSNKFALGLTYIHSYNTDFGTNTGSNNANLSNLGLPFSSNAYGAELTYQFSPHLAINGSVGYTQASVLTGTKGDVDIWNWSVGLAFPDLLRKGSVGGIIVGMEPKVTSASSNLASLEDPNTSLHIEGFYQYQVSDNISITPGVIWLTNPDGNSSNDDVVIGTVRTTFTF